MPLRFLDTNPGEKPFSSPQARNDIDQFSIQQHPFVRICLTKDLPAATPYLTLSHCWGGKPSILLGHNNIQFLSQCIPEADLMAEGASLLRDAILITRSLGYRYIWIDTLCLNQDDDLEKMDQISNMHEFYSNAVLNLSATAAKSGVDSMIMHRHLSTIMPLTIRMAHGDNDNGEAFDSLVFYNDDWGRRIEVQKINSRGWVFQERMLAHRVLHFAEDQVYWECHSLEACDTNPSGKVLLSADQSRQHLKKNLSLRGRQSSRLEKTDNGQYVWLGLLGSYGDTVTTFPADRLMAMSALARTFGQVFDLPDKEYIAGIWLSHLPLALCWNAVGSIQRPKIYRAPTWSWAGIDGKIGYAWHVVQPGREGKIRVIDVDIATKIPTDPFSEVLYGRIRIRGRVFKGFDWGSTYEENTDGDLYELVTKSTEHVTTNTLVNAPSSQRLTFRMSFDVESRYPEIHTPNVSSEGRQPFFLLPLQDGQPKADDLRADHPDVQGDVWGFIGKTCLILRGTRERGQYTREGIVYGNYWVFDGDGEMGGKVNKVEYTGESISEGDFITRESDEEYIIDIV